jgi:VIT1/CCC1 family predicted Fe2+/Mn2+ transporter
MLVRFAGPRRLRPALAATKVRGLSVYNGPARHAMPTAVEAIGSRHQTSSGGTLRAAIFGVNDGLVSNTSLVMGVTGAAASPDVVLLTGTAGLLAGAFSMAAGEYVSMRTQREMFEHQIAQEREELALYPAEEAEELALIYAARGFPIEAAREMATKLVAEPERALDALAREELGLNPDDLGSASGAAWWSFAAFAIGASLPLTPYLAGVENAAFASAIIAAIALFAVGATMSLFSGRHAGVGGLRMLLIGAAAALATWGVGRLFGVAVG